MEENEPKERMWPLLLLVAVLLLAVDCICLHKKCARHDEALRTQASAVATLNAALNTQTSAVAKVNAALDAHLNPPPEPTLGDKAKDTYERAKKATVEGYEKAKSAVSAACQAVKDEYDKK